MATFFGEICRSKSRAFLDSDDELVEDVDTAYLDEALKVYFTDQAIDEAQFSFDNKLFILINGPLIAGFAESCLLSEAVMIAEVDNRSAFGPLETATSDYEDELIAKKTPQKPSKLYALKDSVIVCVCSPDLLITQAYYFTECIKRWLLKSDSVLVLTCESKTSYITDSPDPSSAFLRGLCSPLFKGSMLSKRLEAPNMIMGAPAGVLTYCQIFDIPGIMYVVYTDSFILDSITAQPLVELFSQLNVNLLKNDAPTFKKRLYFGAEVESNLYT